MLVHTGHDWAGDYDQRRPEKLPQWHGPAVSTPAEFVFIVLFLFLMTSILDPTNPQYNILNIP